MKTSESIIKIAPAFLKAQKNIEVAIKDEKNPHYGNTFASHKAVIEACKAHLNAEGIAVLQPPDGMSIETILVHESGEWFSSSTPIVSKDEHNPQALGSAITYAKRYGLQSMVLLPAEDDDGNGASKATTPAKTAPTGGKCADCSTDGLIEKIVNESLDKCGRSLCYSCMTKDLAKGAKA